MDADSHQLIKISQSEILGVSLVCDFKVAAGRTV